MFKMIFPFMFAMVFYQHSLQTHSEHYNPADKIPGDWMPTVNGEGYETQKQGEANLEKAIAAIAYDSKAINKLTPILIDHEGRSISLLSESFWLERMPRQKAPFSSGKTAQAIHVSPSSDPPKNYVNVLMQESRCKGKPHPGVGEQNNQSTQKL